MKTSGAELVGNQRTLPRTRLLQQLKKHRGRAAVRFDGAEDAQARLYTLAQALRNDWGADHTPFAIIGVAERRRQSGPSISPSCPP